MSSTITYTVAGMTCNGCVNKVTNAVTGVPGVLREYGVPLELVDVDVSTGTLEVIGSADDAAVRAAVAEVGYAIVDA